MKAILLTYFKQLGLADLLIKSYYDILGYHPFEYLVPENPESDLSLLADVKEVVTFVPCDSHVMVTLKALLDKCDDEEWIFWAIDDRFPSYINKVAFNGILQDIKKGAFDFADGVKLLHWREVMTENQKTVSGRTYTQQTGKGPFGIWHHHFVRAKVLKRFFFDHTIHTLNDIFEINSFFFHAGDYDFLENIWVPNDDSYVHQAEPLENGKLTINGVETMKKLGCVIPDFPMRKNSTVYYDWNYQKSVNPKYPQSVVPDYVK